MFLPFIAAALLAASAVTVPVVALAVFITTAPVVIPVAGVAHLVNGGGHPAATCDSNAENSDCPINQAKESS